MLLTPAVAWNSTAKQLICRSRPGDFRRLGMSFVHQNLGLVPSLTVLENLRLVQLTTATSGFINWSAERAAAREALTRFGLDLDPGERVDRISPVERALLAIVRAFEEIEAARRLTGKPGLVLLDEPTPFLPAAGVAKLFTLIRSIAKLGSGVIFISHDIDEVMQITDRVTVLRDGVVAGELKTAQGQSRPDRRDDHRARPGQTATCVTHEVDRSGQCSRASATFRRKCSSRRTL